MNIIDILDKEIAKWNNEGRCGLCWQFVPGGRSDYFNNAKTRKGEECCVYVGVLSIRQVSGIMINANQLVRKDYCDWQVRFIAGIPSGLDLQFYNENPDHPKSEGKWDGYISKIFECFGGCCIEMDLCDIHNCQGLDTTVEVTRWESEMVMNYKDINLDGVLVTGTFREWFNG